MLIIWSLVHQDGKPLEMEAERADRHDEWLQRKIRSANKARA